MKTKKEAAAAYFAANKDVRVVFVSDDFQVFASKNLCKLHCDTNRSGKKLEYNEIEKSSLKAKSDKMDKPKSEERIATINALTTVKSVDKALKGETATTVKSAGAAKIKALNEAAAKADPRNDNKGKTANLTVEAGNDNKTKA